MPGLTEKTKSDEPQLSSKESKRRNIISFLQQIYGEEHTFVNEEAREIVCAAQLEYGQQITLTITYDDLEKATDVEDIYQLGEIYGIPEETKIKLRENYPNSLLFLNTVHIVTISNLVINGVDIINKLKQGKVKRIRLMLPELDLSGYEQIPEYPLTRDHLLLWLHNGFWPFDYLPLQRREGDIDILPILSEYFLYILLHEYGHGQENDTESGFPLLVNLSWSELSEINSQLEVIPPEKWNAQQKQYAAFRVLSEQVANGNVLKLLENTNILAALFPGQDGLERVGGYIAKQLARYSRYASY